MCSCCFRSLVPYDPSLAIKSRFLSHRAFCCYKLIMAIYFVFWSVFWPVGEDIHDSFKFVTFWAFYATAVYFVASFLTASGVIGTTVSPSISRGPQREVNLGGPEIMTLSRWGRFIMWLQIFTWNVGCLTSLVVVAIFWSTLYDGDRITSVDINAHIVVALIMAIDQFLVATRYSCEQVWASELFSMAYVIFNVIYYYEGPKYDRPLYDVLDWDDDLGTALIYTIGVLAVLLPVFAVFHLFLFKLREFIHERCRTGSYAKDEAVNMEEGKSHWSTRRLRRSF